MELGLSSTLQELRVLLSGRESNAWEEVSRCWLG